jgi:hypothetical protein
MSFPCSTQERAVFRDKNVIDYFRSAALYRVGDIGLCKNKIWHEKKCECYEYPHRGEQRGMEEVHSSIISYAVWRGVVFV